MLKKTTLLSLVSIFFVIIFCHSVCAAVSSSDDQSGKVYPESTENRGSFLPGEQTQSPTVQPELLNFSENPDHQEFLQIQPGMEGSHTSRQGGSDLLQTTNPTPGEQGTMQPVKLMTVSPTEKPTSGDKKIIQKNPKTQVAVTHTPESNKSEVVNPTTIQTKLRNQQDINRQNPEEGHSIYYPLHDQNSGTIQVISFPTGAKVYLNNNYKGKTPSSGYLDIPSIIPGTYEIMITCSGYNDYYSSISVNSNQVETLDAVLTPITEVQETPSGTGILDVQSDPPGANIYLDNEYKGISPVTLKGINLGDHILTIRMDGYSEYSGGVYIKVDQTTGISATLTPVVSGFTQTETPVQVPVQTTTPESTQAVLPLWVMLTGLVVGGICCIKTRGKAQ